jgi:hypothetical protein
MPPARPGDVSPEVVVPHAAQPETTDGGSFQPYIGAANPAGRQSVYETMRTTELTDLTIHDTGDIHPAFGRPLPIQQYVANFLKEARELRLGKAKGNANMTDADAARLNPLEHAKLQVAATIQQLNESKDPGAALKVRSLCEHYEFTALQGSYGNSRGYAYGLDKMQKECNKINGTFEGTITTDQYAQDYIDKAQKGNEKLSSEDYDKLAPYDKLRLKVASAMEQLQKSKDPAALAKLRSLCELSEATRAQGETGNGVGLGRGMDALTEDCEKVDRGYEKRLNESLAANKKQPESGQGNSELTTKDEIEKASPEQLKAFAQKTADQIVLRDLYGAVPKSADDFARLTPVQQNRFMLAETLKKLGENGSDEALKGIREVAMADEALGAHLADTGGSSASVPFIDHLNHTCIKYSKAFNPGFVEKYHIASSDVPEGFNANEKIAGRDNLVKSETAVLPSVQVVGGEVRISEPSAGKYLAELNSNHRLSTEEQKAVADLLVRTKGQEQNRVFREIDHFFTEGWVHENISVLDKIKEIAGSAVEE